MKKTLRVLGLVALVAVGGRVPAGGTAPPATGASTQPEARKYAVYDHTEGRQALRLVVPEGAAVVRGILIVGPGSGDDSRNRYQEARYREFLHLHDFAYVGFEAARSHADTDKGIRNLLAKVAKDANRPELVHAPYAVTGFSLGGGFTNHLLAHYPEKVIAAVVVGSRLNLAKVTPTAAHLGTPVCVINGENEDEGMAAEIEPVLAAFRSKGALWGWMAVPGGGHERNGQEVLTMPLLDAAVRLRYPADADPRKGPVALKPLDAKAGWVADNTSWKSPLAAVVPAKDFKAAVAKSSWLPNEDVAAIYRAYATRERSLAIAAPRDTRDLVWDAGSSVTITVDDVRFAGWKTLELFDGAKKVGELTKGPAAFTVADLTHGYHAFSVLGTDDKGTVRPSEPVLVVVRKPAADKR